MAFFAARPVAWAGTMLSGGANFPAHRRFSITDQDSLSVFHHGTTGASPYLWVQNIYPSGFGGPEWNIALGARSRTARARSRDGSGYPPVE